MKFFLDSSKVDEIEYTLDAAVMRADTVTAGLAAYQVGFYHPYIQTSNEY